MTLNLQSGDIVNVTDDAETDENASSCSEMAIKFGNNQFTLTFRNNSRMYWLHQVGSYIDKYQGKSLYQSTT